MTSSLPWATAWVTGASSGIGRELTLQLAQAGVKVAASARSADKLAELERQNPAIKSYPLDVTDAAAVAQTAAAINSELGPIDLAVLNAALWQPMGAADFNAKTAIDIMNVNYNGVVLPLASLMDQMVKRKSGHIAMVGSVAGFRGLPKSVTYAPSKAALINLSECLKLDLERHNVKVSIINPDALHIIADDPGMSEYGMIVVDESAMFRNAKSRRVKEASSERFFQMLSVMLSRGGI